jgi:quercetin dioxygenase-like cupin family protein
MPVYTNKDFPCVHFGQDEKQKREVRMLISPDIGNHDSITLVTVVMPPGGLSDAHMHEDSDEFMYFDGPAFTVIDGVRTEVPAGSVVHAPKGTKHATGSLSDQDINIICTFVPAIKPYGSYFELIEKTKEYLKTR